MLTILVVDDRREDRKALADLLLQEPLLQARALRVVEAQDGIEGLEVFQREQPDLVITDLLLPRADGFQLCHGIRELAAGRLVPLLVVSGVYKDVAVAKQLIDNFGAELHPKPLQGRRLMTRVLQTLERGAAAGGGAPPAAPEPRSSEGVQRGGAADPDELSRPLPPPEGAPLMDAGEVTGPALPANAGLDAASLAQLARTRGLNFARPLRTTLEKHPLAWILVQLAALAATGSLRLARAKVRRVIYIVEGQPIYVDSNLRNETLGQVLVSKQVISEEQLAEAMKQARQGTMKLGETLVGMGLADQGTIDEALHGQVRLKLVNSVRWPDGGLSWLPGDDFSSRVPRCPVEAAELVQLVLLVLKKTAAPESLLARLEPHLHQSLRLTPVGEQFRVSVERAFGSSMLRRLLTGMSLRTALQSGVDQASLLILVEALRATGLAELVEAAPDTPLLEASQTGRGSGLLELRDLDPTIPRRRSAVIDLAELELAEPGDQPPPHAVQLDSGVLSIPSVDDLELEPAGLPSPAPPPEGAAAAGPRLEEAEAARLRQLLVDSYAGIHDKNFYQVLDLTPGAAPVQVEDAYRKALDRLSPERYRGAELLEEADKLMELCAIAEQAYSVLSDPLRRQSYDETLAQAQVQPPASPDAFGAELLFQHGQAQLRERAFDGAVEAFRAATRAHPGQPDYHAFLGWALFLARGRGEAGALAARPHLQEALRIAPEAAQPNELAGLVELDVHEHARAADHFGRALQAGAPRQDLFAQLKDLLVRLGRFQELEQQYRQLIFRLRDSEPLATVPLWVDLAGLYALRMGQPANAAVALQVAAKLAPQDPRVRQALAALEAASSGDWRQLAQDQLHQHLAAPDQAQPLHEIARLQLAGGQPQIARHALALLSRRGAATAEEVNALALVSSPELPRCNRPLGAAEQELLRRGEPSPVLIQALNALAPVLLRLVPTSLESLGCREDDRLGSEAWPGLFAEVATYLAAQLQVTLPALVHRSSSLGRAVLPVPGEELSLAVGTELLESDDASVIATGLGRALACPDAARSLLLTRPVDDLKEIVLAGLSLYHPTLRIPEGSRALGWRQALQMATAWREVLETPMKRLMEERRVNLSEGRRGVKRSTARIALVLGGNPSALLQLLEDDSEVVLDLTEFALGEEYVSLRRALGLPI